MIAAMIDKLEMFIALAKHEHFGRAAQECGVTQPSLSAAIKQLEDQLGVMLVWRGSRFRGLTPEGQRVLQWARQIVGDARTMREDMRAVKQGLSGRLRLAVIPTALAMVPRLTAPLAAAHPNLHFTIQSGNSSEILQLLDNLGIDAGLTYLENEPLGRVITVPLYEEDYHLVTRSDAALAGRTRVTWADLGEVPLCLLTPDMQNRRIINQHLSLTSGAAPAPRIESNSVVTLISHVMQGDWATILPIQTADLFLRAGDLVAVPISDPAARHRVGLVAPHREPHTPVLEALLDAARKLSV